MEFLFLSSPHNKFPMLSNTKLALIHFQTYLWRGVLFTAAGKIPETISDCMMLLSTFEVEELQEEQVDEETVQAQNTNEDTFHN